MFKQSFVWGSRLKMALVLLGLLVALVLAGGAGTAAAEESLPVIKVVPGPVAPDNTLTVEIVIQGLPEDQNVGGFNLELAFEPTLLQYKSFRKEDYFTNVVFWSPEPDVDQVLGLFSTSLGRDAAAGGPPGPAGTMMTITFNVTGYGNSLLALPTVELRDEVNQEIPLLKEEAWVLSGEDEVPVTGVALDRDVLAQNAGGAPGTLVATVSPGNATDRRVTWSSDNPAVATVVDGVVTPVAAGMANITVTTVDGGFTAACAVTVYPLGDLNRDGEVDVRDLVLLAGVYRLKVGQPGFDPAHDLNGDGLIDLFDLIILARSWTGQVQ